MRRDGLYRRRSVLVRLEIVRALNLPNGMPWHGSLGKRKPRLSRIEATYRKTTKPDSRNFGLLAGAEEPEVAASGCRESTNGDCAAQNRALAPLYSEADMRVARHGPRLWSRYHLGNALTARSIEGRVPKRTDCAATVWVTVLAAWRK